MSECDRYNPDNIFKRFKLVQFPVSFVNLSTIKYLNVETELGKAAYLKTLCDGTLVKFHDARETSPSHRAFNLKQINDQTIQITFKPLTECISKAKSKKVLDNRFVFDLRLIQVVGIPCCNNELHSEIGRYYISGQYEYCKLSHHPNIIEFGEVFMSTAVTKHVRIKNESNLIATRIKYVLVTGFEIVPNTFLLPPNSSKLLTVTMKPTCLKMKNILMFQVRNPHILQDEDIDKYEQDSNETVDDNFISYSITCKFNILYKKKTRDLLIESQHKINEPDQRYTFVDYASLSRHKERKKEALKHLHVCKSNYARKSAVEKFCTGKVKCYSDSTIKLQKVQKNICKSISERLNIYAIFQILLLPYKIDFGKIGLNTFGEQDLFIKNNTKYDITFQFNYDKYIRYTHNKSKTLSLKINSFCETKVTLLSLGTTEGSFGSTLQYMIDKKFSRCHPYFLQVGNPVLRTQEKILKFGMITNDSFITSVPVRIYNDFNIPVEFKWDVTHFNESDLPFDISPNSGTIPERTCKICDVTYNCKPTKTKCYEVDFVSQSTMKNVVPIELSIITRKLTIKFLQPAVVFKDTPLNIETKERVKLENSSREIATFFVVEPLIPGLKIEPMSGNIRPKMIITFEIILKMACVLDFALDIVVKINNKENVLLPVSGNIVEPKVLIHPKNIFMPRIPCQMITYIPIVLQNQTTLKTMAQVLDTGDENIFDVYIAHGNEKQRVFEFCIEGGQSRTVFIKVMDVFRREYEMYIPFRFNGLLGPPNQDSSSTELQYYIGEYETQYEGNPKVRVKSLNKDISYCKITGVITVPWIRLSVDKFEIDYVPNGSNIIEFTMTNISKYSLYITILTAKLSPIFTLDVLTEDNQSIINESNIKFELHPGQQAEFDLKFHPKMHGRYVSTAILFLDKQMSIPYSNLTFIGKRQQPVMIPDTYRVIFPPCYVGTSLVRTISIRMGFQADLDAFSCMSKEESSLYVKFIKCEVIEEDDELYSVLTVEIKVCAIITYARHIILHINHEYGSSCEIEITFCFTYCVLTLHANFLVKPDSNPYPYFPTSDQTELYDYMITCTQFLEKWMFQQGFRRELYPVIPDTFYAISTVLSSMPNVTKSKSINVSYLSFMKRIAGPLMKHIHKLTGHEVDESFRAVKEIHDTYKEILHLIRSRGADLWILQAKFLLSYDQFVIYAEHVTPKCNADILLTKELLADVELFNRLSKQNWIDLILQTYKVFVIDSCFFDCLCVNSNQRDIVKILIDWYNEHIKLQHRKLRGENCQMKQITNLTTDLSDGIAIASTILTYCPFLTDQFTIFSGIDEEKEVGIVHNACLIIEAMNCLRLFFPLTSKDFLEPNYLQMLFLSIHLYIVLPLYVPKDIVKFNPPLLRSSTRHIGISPSSQESLTFNFIVVNNTRNNFSVEKGPLDENGKKMFLSVKYTANFVTEESCILLVHGYNKTRIFDTYTVFLLKGGVGFLNPFRKCKVTGPIYRPNKVDIQVATPFTTTAKYKLYVTDIEPSVPMVFEDSMKPKFYVRRLHLLDKEVTLNPAPKEAGTQEITEVKVYLQLICLSTQIGNSWVWFRSDIGEFVVRVSTQARWDIPIDTLQARVQTWPIDPCSCGEACECYRTTLLMIPHRNELMVKALRYALLEFASDIMINIFDQLIETTTGKLILGMLLEEGGTDMSEVQHILWTTVKYRISSKTLVPRLDRVELAHHTSAMLPLPVTIPARNASEKATVTFTSECGFDIRSYRILFMESNYFLAETVVTDMDQITYVGL